MQRDFPSRWSQVEIGQIAQIVGGGTPPSKDESCFAAPGHGIAWLTPADLSGFRGQYITRGARDLSSKGLASSSAKLMPSGAVLFSSRAPVGYVAIATQPVATNQGFKSFVLPDGIDSRFAYYQLRHLKPVAEGMATGTTFKELSGSAAARIPFLVAPPSEQRRIAEKLDTVLARVDAVNDRLARVAPLLKRFRLSVLAVATSGKLTEEWRAGRPFSAHAKLLGEVGAVTGGLTKNSKREALPLKRPYLRVANVYADELRLDDVAQIGLTEAEYHKTVLVSGDLLIVEGNGSIDQIGRAAIWRGEVDGCCHQNHLIRWRAGPDALSPFVHLWLMSPEGRAQLVLAASSTTGLHTLSVSKVAGLQLVIPDLDEQAEIVRRVELLFGYVDRLEARLQAAQTAAERLTPALLAKAFRGELVPQDPNDEPASELLRRLRESQASAISKPKRGRRPVSA